MLHMKNHIFSHTSVKFFGSLVLNADFIPLYYLQMSCTLLAVHMETPVYTVSCQVLSSVVALLWLKMLLLFWFGFFLQSCSVLTNCKFVRFWRVDLYPVVSEFSESVVSLASWAGDLHGRNLFFLIWTYHISSALSVAIADTTCHGERVFPDSPSTVCCCWYHVHNLLLGA